MKGKFIAKYIPVDGEIEEDDKAINPSNNKVVRVNKACLKNLVTSEWKKVRLFICSTDIKVGDLVRYQDDDWGVPITVSDTMRLKEWIKKGDETIFKIVGEISIAAIWVKENDEFDKKDLAYLMGEPPKYPFYFQFKNIKQWDIEGMKKYPIAIKCSQCNTYH